MGGAAAVELTLAAPLIVLLLLFVVLAGRLATAQLDVNAAAHAAARAASLQRDTATAAARAREAADAALTDRGLTCQRTDISIYTGSLRPGATVTVTVKCVVSLADLSLLRVPGSRAVEGSASSPVDTWRGGSP